MSKIMKEIAKKTGEGQQDKGEDTQAYRHRLLASTRILTDDEWGVLSPRAQEWANEATKAENAGEELPDFPDEIEKTEVADDAPPSSTKTRSAKKGKDIPMSTKKKKLVAKESVRKKSAGGSSTKKANSSAPKKRIGAQDFLKMEVLRDINISSDELMLKLKKKGFKVSDHTVSSMRSSFRNSVKMMQDAGYLKKRIEF